MLRASIRLRLSRFGTLSKLSVVVLALCGAQESRAQSPYPATPMAAPSWGGYVVDQPVPYQPTMVDPSCNSGAQTVPWVEPTGAVSVGVPVPVTQYASEQLPAGGVPIAPPMAPGSVYPATDGMGQPMMSQPAFGQPVMPSQFPPYPGTGMADGYSSDAAQANPYYGQGAPQSTDDASLPAGTRNGVFQTVDFSASYLPRFETDSLGMSDLELDVVFGVPFMTRESPLVITPFYNLHFLDGPDSPTVPPRLNDAAIEFRHFRNLGERWLINVDITIGEYTDDHSFGSSDALRLTGSGAAVYEWSLGWKWVLGAAYVNRLNTRILPIAGLIYEPNDDVEYMLVFPAPKMAWRLPWTPVPGRDERWFYLAGEFGGGVWAVQQADGSTQDLDITDWRLYLGLERRIVGGLSRRIELGYVFARELQYSNMPSHVSLDDTLMLRAGITY